MQQRCYFEHVKKDSRQLVYGTKTISLSTKVAYTMSYTVNNSELKYANVIELSHRVNR